MADSARQCKIKLGAAKRTLKEYQHYVTDITTQSEKISKMKAAGAEFHDVKQQEEVLKESEACVIDSKRRLDGVLQDLEAMVEEHGEALGDNEDLKAAKELLAANPPPEN